MALAEILFFVLAGLTIISGLLTVLSKNPVYSILFLIITFFSISGHYILLNAQFLAIVNIIVYAGAIMVLFLFVVMLMNLNKEKHNFSKPFVYLAGTLVCGIFLALSVGILFQSDITQNNQTLLAEGNIGLTEIIGKKLYTDYVVPFELASILFMGAMIGSVLLSKKNEDFSKKD